MSIKIRKEDALNYHTQEPAGKLEITPTKVLSSQYDLALAYSPGVADPCLEIHNNTEDVYKYTAKGNLVAVISNGTAVLGLGNIGPEASKPVMEGKAVLFKKFAGIDVFDIEINESDPDKFIAIVKSLEPTFGGINLEDIKAPECFKIEQELKKSLNIPIMHDDQHGTAIISAAALINAVDLCGKKLSSLKMVVNGAGAAAYACTKIYMALGARKENIIMCDSKGVITKDRDNLTPEKAEFATNKKISTLHEALEGADFFLGLSVGNIITPEDLMKMAKDPIVFALANPDPEIAYDVAMETRDDIIMATGRSDHPNQVNNVLGFPYIFRGALDVHATEINEEMKLAAAHALAKLAKEPVPDIVIKAYSGENIHYGKDYLIPKPLDPRLLTSISPAVAKSAMKTGAARKTIEDWAEYDVQLQKRIGIDQKLMSRLIERAKKDPKNVVFAEAHDPKILMSAQVLVDEKIAYPVLLGKRKVIEKLIKEYSLELENCPIYDPYEEDEMVQKYAEILFRKRQRKGLTQYAAEKLMRDRNYFGAMMVELGEADALVSGLTKDYPRTIRPALQIIGIDPEMNRVAGMYVVTNKNGTYFFADTTVNVNPNVEELVDIIKLTARAVNYMDVEPRIAVLSYSNFGSSKGDIPSKTAEAVKRVKEEMPELIIDGDIQADVALSPDIQRENYPFSSLAEKGANTLIFPNLESGNISYKLVHAIGNAETIGPILLGMNKPVHILQLGSGMREIINMSALAVVDAQLHESRRNNN